MRIVSLCPSLTELVFDLGRGDELVGLTEYCVHPANRVVGIEKVGGTKTPDVARIVELAPDVVLMNEEENRVEDADELEAAGVACHTSLPRDTDETAAMVRSIGRVLASEDSAERIARDIEERSARVRDEARGRPIVPFAYLIWREPWMTVNSTTFAHALLTDAGGLNVFSDQVERYPTIRLEDLGERTPALVLLCTEPFAFEDQHAEELSRATGLPRETFEIADGEYLSWHGSRTPDGIDYAASLIALARARIGGAA
jgi:ABC-type Fe3+-hydroxamate transport system substrate-binding protein